jgi:TnpA family transposase
VRSETCGDQIGADPTAFITYARWEETRRDHIARLMIYLDVRSSTAQDRRAALLSAIEAAAVSYRALSHYGFESVGA